MRKSTVKHQQCPIENILHRPLNAPRNLMLKLLVPKSWIAWVTFLMEDKRDCKFKTYCWTSADISPRFWISTPPIVSSWDFSTLEDKSFLLHKSTAFTLSCSNPCTSSSVLSALRFSKSLSSASRFFSRQSLYSALRSVYLHLQEGSFDLTP